VNLLGKLRIVISFFALALGVAPSFAATCEGLSEVKLPDTTIASAQIVAAGAFALPGAPDPAATARLFGTLPAFCRVTADIKPNADSDIKIEVWMPVSAWNGKYSGVGNGGFAGSISYQGLVQAVRNGYATASTDTGHTGGATEAGWAIGHPEKMVDFGFRGIHEMTLKAKAIIREFYGDNPRRSYFASCSNGGREALMEAQRYPEDYDGIIAGAPANYWTHLLIKGIWDLQALQADPVAYIPAKKVAAISAAALAACDAKDGVTDGIIADPRECHFDPGVMLCNGPDSDSCLTAAQVAAIKKLQAGPRTSKGELIFPGYVPGGEEGGNGWPAWVTGSAPGTSAEYEFTHGFFANMVYGNPEWDFKTFNFDKDVKVVDEKVGSIFNSTDPNLKGFKARGGKLILYHGWSDAAIEPENAINYFNSVVAAMGEQNTSTFLRLYMAPGMQHCGGGPGPNSFGQSAPGTGDAQHNLYAALEQWVEKGMAPDKIIATKFANDMNPAQGVRMTRPLCPYPQAAKYKGTGDTNDAANFECASGKK
jgi:feruloyl esterase